MADAKRTYVVETYGCQMNVHDSERIAGLLEADGYVPAATPETADVVVVNTCSVRERAEEKLFTRLGEIRAAAEETGHRPAGRRRRLRGAAGRRRDPEALAPGRRRRRHAGGQAAAVAGRSRRRRHAGAAHRPAPARRRLVPVRADPARRPGPRLRHHHRRLQRVLLVLRRAVHARPRAHAAGRGDPRRSAARRGDGPAGSPAARPDRQPLPGARSRRRRLRGAPRARARGRGAGAHPLRQPASAPLHAAHDRRDPRPAEGLQAPPHAGAVRLDADPEGDAPALFARGVPRSRCFHPRDDSGRRAVHGRDRGVPRRERRALRGDAVADARGAVPQHVLVQVLAAAAHAGGAALRRRRVRAREEPPHRRAAAAAADHPERDPGGNGGEGVSTY